MGCLNSKSAAEKSRAVGKSSQKKATEKVGKDTGNSKATSAKPAAAKAAPDNKLSSGTKPNGSAPTDGGSSPPEKVAETFLKTILHGADHFFSTLPDPHPVKQVVALTFMNSCVEVVRTKYRMKADDVVELATDLAKTSKLSLLLGCMGDIEERSMDDSFSRILLAWHSNNPSLTNKIPAEAGQAVLDTLYIRYTTSKPISFEDVLVYQFRWVTINQTALEVFGKFTEGRDSMSKEQMGKFLRETQGVDVTDRQMVEKFKYRFGGGIHRYNFASYSGSVLTNNAVDPARTSDVWQDMTQSFTHYMVRTARIESEEDLNRATHDSTRTFVLNIRKNGDKICSGSCPLQTVVEAIKKHSFTTTTYPVVLCLSPSEAMPLALQAEVANILTEGFGPLLAKGLMFEGAVISDPKFSPGALRKKVLVMGPQAKLRPFIGFMVADMNKDGLGVRVTDVVEATPAAKGGVQKDDWLTHFNNQPIQNKQHLRESLAKLKVGEEFSVRRENLDEIKIVVGGVVDTNDTGSSPELSALIFFKYAPGSSSPKPWDTERLDPATLKSLVDKPKMFMDHFGLVSINHRPNANDADEEGAATRLGVQFIDVDNSERSLSWCRGRFYDNGCCGYLLKTDMDQETSSDLNLSIIAGPRAVGCSPLSSATVRIHGVGTSRISGSQISFTGCDEGTVAVVHLHFESGGVERVFTASFTPALIRPGYRALPCIPHGEERPEKKHIHGVYLFAKH